MSELFDKGPRIVSLLWVKEIKLWFAWELTPVNGFIPTGESSFQDRDGNYWIATYSMFTTDERMIQRFLANSEYWQTTYIGTGFTVTH
jgi:hypothetical protein